MQHVSYSSHHKSHITGKVAHIHHPKTLLIIALNCPMTNEHFSVSIKCLFNTRYTQVVMRQLYAVPIILSSTIVQFLFAGINAV